jgi:Trk-type K+ transport system membrane component
MTTDRLPTLDDARPASLASWLLPAWLVSMLLGAVLLSAVGSDAGNELTADRALFTAANAVTLTGFAGARLEDLNVIGQLIVLVQTLFGAFTALAVGGSLLSRAIGSPCRDRTVIAGTLGLLAIALVGGTPLLAGVAGGWIEGAQLAVGSLGNCGIAWDRPPALGAWQTHVIVLPLAVVGGLGVPVVLELLGIGRAGRPLSRHTIATLVTTAAVYLCGLVVIVTLCGAGDPRPMSGTTLLAASVLSVDARSLGASVVRATDMPATVAWVVMLLMLVGASPGGAGGGVKGTTLAMLARGVRDVLRGRTASRVFAVAMVWVGVYVAAIAVVTIALVATVPQVAGDRLLFLAISAIGTVGLSHEPVTLVGLPLQVLTLAMIFGRVAPFVVLWWVARVREADEVAVG